jgi:hypothetical protein
MQNGREGEVNMSDDMSESAKMLEYRRRFNDLQTEATIVVMRMSFFLNYGGIVATLAAFGSTVFQAGKCPIILCLFIFIMGLASAILMALELRRFAFNISTKANDHSTNENSLKAAIQTHRGIRTVHYFCISSLVFFGIGIIVGFLTLFISL